MNTSHQEIGKPEEKAENLVPDPKIKEDADFKIGGADEPEKSPQ